MSEHRAVTSAVEFVLTLAIATALMSGLIVAASDTVERQKTATAQSQMESVGHQVAGTIESADRLHRTAATTTLRLERDLPPALVQRGYALEVTASEVVVTSPLVERPVSVALDSDTPVAQTTTKGGDIAVRYTGTRLEVVDD
ncbi:hypothetical protein GOC74_10930 [Halomicrobium mukohataei]|uniref:Uncharacterized protein n=1 Tax=Halomicrobium mukohataei TaxID=57705 RepID=A0A847UGT3_9EURY|nr:hypothetical protein [Halomicrobium mukohataei]NLV10441.1 hypothetical protein [Halomicrobium mukohataei]